jgi:glycosyltransferase involved in cell wall biosynthesis
VDGVPEVVTEGVDGVLVDPADTAELAEALSALLVDAGRRSALARAGHDTVVRRFHQDRVFSGVEAGFEDLVQRRRTSRVS